MAARNSGSRAWARRRESRSTPSATCSSATAAAQFSKSAPAGRYSCSRRSSLPSAYHLAFSPTGELFVTGPTTSSFDRVFRINQKGEISTFFRGLGRPQGLAFDRKGNLYVTASYAGRRGIVRIAPDGTAELVLGGSGLVGLTLLPGNRAILATSSALFSLDWDVEGLPLPR